MKGKKEIRPSLLDRLMAEGNAVTGSFEYHSMHELRESVRRDLASLLNTRIRFISVPDNLTNVQQSIANFGMPDLASQNLVSERGRHDFARWMEKTIRHFEPRFKNVKVVAIMDERTDFRLRFRVEAVLYADPAPEMVAFDSMLDPLTQSINVNEARI